MILQQLQGMQMPQQSINKVIPINELLSQMRQATGLEEAPKRSIDPFANPMTRQPRNAVQEASQADIWNPINSEFTQKVNQKKQEDSKKEAFVNHPTFMKMEGGINELIEALADEVLDTNTPFGNAEAEATLIEYLEAELDKGGI